MCYLCKTSKATQIRPCKSHRLQQEGKPVLVVLRIGINQAKWFGFRWPVYKDPVSFTVTLTVLFALIQLQSAVIVDDFL